MSTPLRDEACDFERFGKVLAIPASQLLPTTIAHAAFAKPFRWLSMAALALAAFHVAALTNQTITFGPLANITFGAAPFTVSATASSGLPVSFTSATKSVCTVTGSTVTPAGAGTCTVQVSQAGNATYAAAPNVSQSFAIDKANQTITFGPPGDKTMAAAPFTISATASSKLEVSFLSTTNAVCTFGGGKVRLVAAGTCRLQADQIGNASYNAAPSVTQSLNVVQEPQTIVFGVLPDKPYGSGAFNVAASASSGLTVTFTSSTTPVCTVNGKKVTLLATGICILQASQAGDETYVPAPNVSQSFAVTKVNQTIDFKSINNKTLGVSPFRISASATSDLAVTFASDNQAVCTINGDTVTVVAAAVCTIEASQAGNANYNAAAVVERNFTITSSGKASQTIAFAALSNRPFGATPFTINATASSGLTVAFSSLTNAVCTISNIIVTITGIGTCTVRASQSGNAMFAAAPTVDQSFAVSQGSQTITFAALNTQALSAAPFSLTATASSGLVVVFASVTPAVCSVGGNTVTLVSIGTCTIRASQPGSTTYAAAPAVDQSFMVTQVTQTISFGVLGDKPLSASPIFITATASSGLPVTFSSMSPVVCTVSSNLVMLIAVGNCIIRASQAGNTGVPAAVSVDRSFISGVGPDEAIQYSYDATGNLIQLARSPLPARPDLTLRNLSVGKITVNVNGSFNIPVTFEVHNVGWAPAVAPWSDRAYLSTDSVLHDSDQPLSGYSTRATTLGVGANYLVSATFTTNSTTAVGNYTLIVRTDGGAALSGQYSATGGNNVVERDEANNSQTAVVAVTK